MEAYYNCLGCMNRRVRILTMDGQYHEGTIVKVDQNNVYLKTESNGRVQTSAFYPGYGYGNQILTLSLFTLLAIALI
ncbi:UNVERIFIED_CONTAM: small nuclear ribonucleoprotein (snRNP)-like protein [Paenibacillus sp. PvR008]